MNNVVGKNISNKRKELGWTQEELASKMGYKSKSTINKIELGINDIPQSKIMKFADVLGTTPAYIMGWEAEEKRTDILADVIYRAKNDSNFEILIEQVSKMDDKQVQRMLAFLDAFSK